MELHIEYCKGFGVSKEEMEATAESQGMFLSSEMEKTKLTFVQPAQRTQGKDYS
jgi:hypothetical protein